MAASKTISSSQLAAMSAADRLAFYREAAKSLAPATTAKSATTHVVVRANVAAAELINAFADGRDAYRVTRAMRGM